MHKHVTIIINEKPYHFESSRLCPDDFRNAVSAASDYEVWQVIRSPDPEGQLPKDDVQVVDCIEVKSGDRFKVVPPGTFGAPQGAPILDGEVKDLRELGLAVELQVDGGGSGVIVRNFPLPPGFTVERTDLMWRIPANYPHAHPDMFYVDVGVLLEGGGIPRNADQLEIHFGRQWRRFSWHLNNRWHPGKDNLVSYLGFVDARLAKRV